MRTTIMVVPVFLLVMLFGTLSKAVAVHSDAMPVVALEQKELSIHGELLKVDTSAMTLTIKPGEGDEITLVYDTNTKVEGSQDGIQGLSPESGTKVIVFYEERSGKKVATRIEIVKTDG